MSAAILDVRNLAAGYGKKQIVHDVDLTLDRGEILLMLGHNGAGKTTLMRAIFGLLKPTAGDVIYDGKPIAGRAPGANVAEGIAFVPQGHGIFRTLSVRDNLELGGFIMADKTRLPARMKTIFELFPILGERQQQIGGTLSGGQQQMLAIGMALMHEPRVVILDEPSIGLAPNLVDRVMQSIARDQPQLWHLYPDGGAERALQPADRQPGGGPQGRPQDLRRAAGAFAGRRRTHQAILRLVLHRAIRSAAAARWPETRRSILRTLFRYRSPR